MTSVRISLFAAAAVLISSCGGGGGSAGTVIAQDRLDDALLTLDEFDGNWVEDMRDVFTSRVEGPQAFDPAGWCPEAQSELKNLADIESLAGDSGAAVEFRHEPRAEGRMFHGISQQVWSNADVQDYFDLVSQGFDICSGQTWSPEEDQNVTVSTLESPDLGDRSLALNISIVTPGPDGDYVWKSRMVIVVVGSSLMILRDLDVQLDGGEPFMAEAEWSELVRVAVDRFASVARDA